MAWIENLLHQHGHKYTRPRQIVADVLEDSHKHMSANEIWEAVQGRDATVGRMSVYRTLELFTQIGYIRPASQSDSDARSGLVYVVMHDGHHHHLVCQGCGEVIEFETCGLEHLIQALEQQYSFQISGHLLEFFGKCADCNTPASFNNHED